MISFIDGAAGRIQLLVEMPPGAPRGIAMISHPQPLLGGSPMHPVPHAIARHVRQAGWIAVRPSFRGVDGSEGRYTGGPGEADDAARIAARLRGDHPGLPLALVGFSFGAHVYARLACRLEAEAPAAAIVLLGLPVGDVPSGRGFTAQPLPARTLLLHGECDAMAPLENLMAWARGERRPVAVFAGADHFFKGCLPQALAWMQSVLDRAARPLA